MTLSCHSSHFTDSYIQPSAMCPLAGFLSYTGIWLTAHSMPVRKLTGRRSQWWVRTGFAPVSLLISAENIRRKYLIYCSSIQIPSKSVNYISSQEVYSQVIFIPSSTISSSAASIVISSLTSYTQPASFVCSTPSMEVT